MLVVNRILKVIAFKIVCVFVFNGFVRIQQFNSIITRSMHCMGITDYQVFDESVRQCVPILIRRYSMNCLDSLVHH